MGFRWVLLKLFSQVVQNTRLWMSDLAVPNIICSRTYKQLATLNKMWVLLKSVLTDLRACSFVHRKSSLRVRCMHTHHRANVYPISQALRNPMTLTNFENTILKHIIFSFDGPSNCLYLFLTRVASVIPPQCH